MSNKREAGVTLIELIVAIVIVGIALAGVVAAFARTDRASVDPVVTQQMAIVAAGMMEEILLKDFANANAKPAARTAYTQAADYNGYKSIGIVDAEGNAVPGLSAYDVAVEVGNPDPAHALQGVPTADTLRIQVTVTNRMSESKDRDPVVLTGWRTRPPAPPPAPAAEITP
nr:type II secretion system protein [uncultured Massilia sp.]